MIKKILVVSVLAASLSGCYTKKVEKTETNPERVIVERPERHVVIEDRDETPRASIREERTVIEHD